LPGTARLLMFAISKGKSVVSSYPRVSCWWQCWMFCAIALGWCNQLFAEQPAAAILREQAEQCRELLDRSVVDFYLPGSLDATHGGYLEELDSAGRFSSAGSKFLVLQARQQWLFSTLAEAGIRPQQTRAAADSGFQFLQSHVPIDR
jgi:hypothetical protein